MGIAPPMTNVLFLRVIYYVVEILTGKKGLEPLTFGFGDHYSTIESLPIQFIFENQRGLSCPASLEKLRWRSFAGEASLGEASLEKLRWRSFAGEASLEKLRWRSFAGEASLEKLRSSFLRLCALKP